MKNYVPKRGATTGRFYFDQMKEIITDAADKGISREEIARIAEVDISTVWHWFKTGVGSTKPVRKLLRHLKTIENPESFDQSKQTQNEEKVTEFFLSTVDGQRVGIITIFNDVLKKLS